MTKAEITEYFKQIGQKGGKARKVKLTPERRQEIAVQANQARWKDHKKTPANPAKPTE